MPPAWRACGGDSSWEADWPARRRSTLGPAFWRDALAATARARASAYGALGPPDANGLRLPPGFTAREIARANKPVPGTAYPWHIFPDGQATFPAPGGGWVLVSNSESLAPSGAGSSAIRFDADGSIAAAYRILSGTNANCAGGGTPWGTWLSCEEHDYGVVWECDPSGAGPGPGAARARHLQPRGRRRRPGRAVAST